MQKKSIEEVCVVGGGVVGLSAAIVMALRGLDVTVLDAGACTTTNSNLRVYAFNRASQALFEEIGAWAHLQPNALAPYQKMQVWDDATGAHIDFDPRSIGKSCLGHMLQETDLKQALLTRIASLPNITLCPNTTLRALDVSQPIAHLKSDTAEWFGRFVMIADGALSAARTLLGVGMTSWPYQQHALIATVCTEKPHEQTASQVFLNEGPLAFLPLADRHQCSIVWSASPERISELAALPEDAFNTALTRAFAHRLGHVSLHSERRQFPLVMRHAKTYVGKQWLLMGDAAHTFHPLAGQGLNVGLADVACWQHVMNTYPQWASKHALSRYQRERKHAVWQSIALMEGLKRTFEATNTPFSLLRGLGLRACNRLSPLKRKWMAYAMGEIDTTT